MYYESPISEYILGIDVLQGVWLQTTVGKFCLQVRVVKAILWGHAKHPRVQLLLPTKGDGSRRPCGLLLKTWGLPVTLSEVQEACETCVVCSQEHSRRTVGTTGQVMRG